jgi:hypothetical protein
MRPESLFEAWKRRRRASRVPDGFADRVMSALRQEPAPRAWAWRWIGPEVERFLTALLASRLGKLGICTLGCLACAFRILSLIALFLPR